MGNIRSWPEICKTLRRRQVKVALGTSHRKKHIWPHFWWLKIPFKTSLGPSLHFETLLISLAAFSQVWTLMQSSSDDDSDVEIMMMMMMTMMMILIGLELILMQSVSPPLKYVSSRNFSRFSHQSNSKDSVQNVKHPTFKLSENRTNALMFHKDWCWNIGTKKVCFPHTHFIQCDLCELSNANDNSDDLNDMMAMVEGLRSQQYFGKMRWLMAKQDRGKKIGSFQISGWDSKFDDFTQSGRGKGRLSFPYLCGDGLR